MIKKIPKVDYNHTCLALISLDSALKKDENSYFLKDVDIAKLLVCNKNSFGKKSCKYFIGYLYNGHKINPLHKMLPKTSAYVNIYDGQTK